MALPEQPDSDPGAAAAIAASHAVSAAAGAAGAPSTAPAAPARPGPSRSATRLDGLLAALPGLGLAIAVGAAGLGLEPHAFGLGSVTVAIALGIAVANLARLGTRFDAGLRACEKVVLAVAVALLGAELDLATLGRLGWEAAATVTAVVGGVTGLGVLAARLFGLPPSLGILLGVGNAVCGISAIAAAAPLVARDREETGLSVSVVNLLGAIGIFLVPAIAGALHLATDRAGLLIGASLQAVGHVVAAGFTLGEVVGRTATAVKMARVALLGPLILVISWLVARRAAGAASGGGRASAVVGANAVTIGAGVTLGSGVTIAGGAAQARPPLRVPLRLPPYLYGFVAFAIAANTGLLPAAALPPVKSAGKHLLLVAMAGIGLQIRVRSLLAQGPRALAAGALVFAIQLGALVLLALRGQ